MKILIEEEDIEDIARCIVDDDQEHGTISWGDYEIEFKYKIEISGDMDEESNYFTINYCNAHVSHPTTYDGNAIVDVDCSLIEKEIENIILN